ncbi:MAG: transposase [Isosphaeraceae bacterium]|nr:transposase [Isosphaeraceae bacterium]
MRKPRKNYTPVERVAILRCHLIDHVPVSDLCDEHQLSPTLFYAWQKQFFENGPTAFERKNAAPESQHRNGGESLLTSIAPYEFKQLQLLTLNPERMGQPAPQQRAVGGLKLAKDGSNIAEYLQEIRQLDLGAVEGLVEALRYILPYVADLQPTLTSEAECLEALNRLRECQTFQRFEQRVTEIG